MSNLKCGSGSSDNGEVFDDDDESPDRRLGRALNQEHFNEPTFRPNGF